MTTETQTKLKAAYRILALIGLALIVVAYFSPIWWVSLKAPNYPAEAFPDGVRIHFHMNGVFNGCKKIETAEKSEEEALDCVHEMDAINHFVGMYPIASGGVVEKAFSPFLVSMLGVMVIGFLISSTRFRVGVMAVGFAGVAGWMAVTMFGDGGIKYQTPGYLSAMVTSLGQGEEETGEPLSPIIAKLRESLEKSGRGELMGAKEAEETVRRGGAEGLAAAMGKLHAGEDVKKLAEILEEAKASGKTGKELDIAILRSAYEADQAKLPPSERQEWTGSNWQVLYWHYAKALGRWFNNPQEIRPLVATMKVVGQVVFWGSIAAMAFVLFAAVRTGGLLYWLLPLVPALLPVFFLIEYSGWLWWYGHSLNEMGAFTLKPFMPTVLGQGKVAQFTTYSYPHYGFALMVGAMFALLLSMLLRRKQLKEAGGAATAGGSSRAGRVAEQT
jgi:hypothetical protein